MATDATFGNPTLEPKKGGSGKLLLGLGIGCGVVVLLCCGGVFLAGYMGMNAMVMDKAKVQTLADGIAQIDRPAELQPQMGMDIKVPFAGKLLMKMAMFGEHELGDPKAGKEGAMMMLAEFPAEYGTMSPEELQGQMDQQMASQGRGAAEFNVQKSRNVSLDIRGAKSTFQIQTGQQGPDKIEMVRAVGTFKGHEGTAFLMLSLPADKYTEEQVEQILHSIK